MMSNDETYEKQVQSEEWYNWSGFCNLEKVKKHIPSFKYFIQDQNYLESNCTQKVFKHVMSKKNLFESKNAKSLARSGVPCRYIREFLLKMFNITYVDQSFRNRFSHIFKGRDVTFIGDYVPYFTGYKTLAESLSTNFLTEQGIQALKEILWVINSTFSFIEFSPTLIKLASIILLFCNQMETYEIMRSLIELNSEVKETSKIRWHFRYNFNDNIKIISSVTETFREICGRNGKDISDHFDKLNFPVEKLYEDMIYGYLLNYLNFEGMIRFLPFFMIEGVKTLYRMSYALLTTHHSTITKLASPDDIFPTIHMKSKGIVDLDKLFNLAYSFKLNRNNNKYDFQKIPEKDLFATRRNYYHLPYFSSPSKILREKEIINLWSILPQFLRVRDAKIIFDTETNGYSLSTICGLNENSDYDSTILFLIETIDDEAFGGIVSNLIKHTNGKFNRPLQSNLVTIRPNLKIYEAEKTSDEIIYCDTECLMFGNGADGPAFRIDKSLNGGFSYPSKTFNTPVLVSNTSGEFKVKRMEIFLLG